MKLLALLLSLFRNSSPKRAPDAVSEGWAYNVQQQVEARDAHDKYLRWVRSL